MGVNMKFSLLLSLLIMSVSVWANPGDLISITHLTDEAPLTIPYARQKFCPDVAHETKVYGFKRYKLAYKTNDLKGNEVESAGLLILPDTTGSFPMYVYQHGTLFGRSELPSSNPQYREGDAAGYCFASLGYVAVLTDYLGFGDGTGVHPYLHAASEAWTGRDMMRASRVAVKELGAELNSQLFIAGYSQGGHAAMALARLLEQDPSREFQITALAPMAGPYALAETVTEVIANPSEHSASEAAYLLLGLNSTYSLYENLNEVILEQYVSTVEPLFDGTHDWKSVLEKLSMRPDQLIQPLYLKGVQEDPNFKFIQALQENEVYHWRPSFPVRFYHGHADREVPFSNSEVAYDYFTALGVDVQLVNVGELDHSSAAPLAFGQAALWFETFR